MLKQVCKEYAGVLSILYTTYKMDVDIGHKAFYRHCWEKWNKVLIECERWFTEVILKAFSYQKTGQLSFLEDPNLSSSI